MSEACLKAGYQPGEDVVFALDVAASEFYQDGVYNLETENTQFNSSEFIDYLSKLSSKYPVVSIEDGLDQEDWQNWSVLTEKLKNTQIVGDDLLVTNIGRLEHAVEKKAANSILIKPNQIGTLSETISAINYAKNNGFKTIVSHRSGETEDTTIAHLAIGSGSGQIKTGSLSRGERTAKYNEIMRIESIDQSLEIENSFV